MFHFSLLDILLSLIDSGNLSDLLFQEVVMLGALGVPGLRRQPGAVEEP